HWSNRNQARVAEAARESRLACTARAFGGGSCMAPAGGRDQSTLGAGGAGRRSCAAPVRDGISAARDASGVEGGDGGRTRGCGLRGGSRRGAGGNPCG